MNSDGKLTVTDLSLLIHTIEKTPDSEASQEFIELKDVTGNTLYYRSEEGSTHEVQVLDITGGLPQDLENYYAVIEMENLPDLYAGIREFYRETDTGRVYAVLDQSDIIRYEENGTMVSGYTFPLAYQNEEGAHFPVASAEELFRKMASNPKGSFELTEDIDASGISDSAAAVPGTFTGELNGNGYRILNLRTSVFDALSNAAVRDLVIENADITTERRGILANTIANRTVIENVFIINSSIANGVDGLGAFAGELNNGMIRESAALDVSVKGLVAAGGIVGKTNGADTVIENCYVTGKVQGTYDHWNLGARVGGITGWHGGGSIRHSYTRVQIIAPARKGNGGIIGGPNAGSPIIENCLSMSTGAGYRIAGFDVLDQAKNLYEYAGSDSETNITEANKANVKTAENIYDKSLFADTLGFDGAIWNLELLSYRKLPNLIHGPVMENQYGIPNYSQVRQAEGYRMDREQAYANMAKLMPFGDTRMWVEYGNALSAADELAVRTVQFVLPLDGDSGLVTGIFRDSPEKVEKIRIVFENETMREYPVSYRKLLGNLVASYRLEGTDLNYQFHHYAAKPDQALLAQAAGLAGGYDYEPASHRKKRVGCTPIITMRR